MKRLKYFFNLIVICICVGLVFVGSGYFYLDKKLSRTENKSYQVPYVSQKPENAGVLFKIDQTSFLVYLDFEDESIRFVFDESENENEQHLYGYTADYTVKGDFDLISGIIDILGGLELEREGETFRYTGVQITNMILKSNLDREFVNEIIIKITEKIKKLGFQNQDFLYIIENSSTNLGIPNCYYWSEHISRLCANVQIIN